MGGFLTRLAGGGARRAAFGAVVGVVAGVAIFLAVSHSGASPTGANGNSSPPAAASPAVAPSSGAPSSGPAAGGSSAGPSSATSGSPSGDSSGASKPGAGSSSGGSGAHGSSTSSTTAGAASPASGVERAHGSTATTFSITADGNAATDTINQGTSAVLAEVGLPVDATGTVTFTSGAGSGSVVLCTITLGISTSCTTDPALPATDYSGTTAAYGGDGTYAGSISTNSVDLDVVTPTTLSLVSNQNPSTYGVSVGFTATIPTTDGDGTVSFYADGSPTPIAGCSDIALSAPGGGGLFHTFFERPHDGGGSEYTASCETSDLSAGNHPITAVYSGDASYGTSTGDLTPDADQTVNPITVEVLASSPTVNYGDPPPTITPSYFANDAPLSGHAPATPPTCVSTYTTGSPANGDYSTSCSGAADPDYTFEYAPGTVTVNVAPTAFTIGFSGTTSPDTIDYADTATLTESGLPSGDIGTVAFTSDAGSGSVLLCTATLPTTTCVTSTSLPVADYTGITGSFTDTDGNYQDSTSSDSVELVVDITPTTTQLISSANPSAFSESVTFTATVSADDGDGSVAFSSDGDPISGCGSEPLTPDGSTEQATCTTTALPFGTDSITAAYSGDAGYDPSSNSPALSQVVSLTPTSFTITVNTNPSSATVNYGTAATLAESGLPGDATGSVVLSSGSTTLCAITLSSGTSCTTSTGLAAGAYNGIQGVFTDTDGNYGGSTSTNSVDLTVSQLTTATAVTSSPPSPTYGQSITFTATVSPDDAGGTVAFSADGNPIAGCGAKTLATSGSNAKATCADAALTAGSHSITAVYSGDTDYAGSTSPTFGQNVGKAATSFTITVNGSSSATIAYGATATLAESGLPGGATGSVVLTSGSTTLCTITLASETSCPTSAGLPVATYSGISGAFTDTDGNYSGSTSTGTVTLTVTTVGTTTSVQSSANPSVYGSSVTFTASVTATDGGGSVGFTANGSTIAGCGSEALSLVSGTYEATCSTSALSAANHPIGAAYAGDTHYAPSSGTLSGGQVVNRAPDPFSITVNTASSATIDFGQTATLADVGLPPGPPAPSPLPRAARRCAPPCCRPPPARPRPHSRSPPTAASPGRSSTPTATSPLRRPPPTRCRSR